MEKLQKFLLQFVATNGRVEKIPQPIAVKLKSAINTEYIEQKDFSFFFSLYTVSSFPSILFQQQQYSFVCCKKALFYPEVFAIHKVN